MTSGLPDTDPFSPAVFLFIDPLVLFVSAAATPALEATEIVDALLGARLVIDGARDNGRWKPVAVAGREIFETSATEETSTVGLEGLKDDAPVEVEVDLLGTKGFEGAFGAISI